MLGLISPILYYEKPGRVVPGYALGDKDEEGAVEHLFINDHKVEGTCGEIRAFMYKCVDEVCGGDYRGTWDQASCRDDEVESRVDALQEDNRVYFGVVNPVLFKEKPMEIVPGYALRWDSPLGSSEVCVNGFEWLFRVDCECYGTLEEIWTFMRKRVDAVVTAVESENAEEYQKVKRIRSVRLALAGLQSELWLNGQLSTDERFGILNG